MFENFGTTDLWSSWIGENYVWDFKITIQIFSEKNQEYENLQIY